jgi:hypothetical protein
MPLRIEVNRLIAVPCNKNSPQPYKMINSPAAGGQMGRVAEGQQ